MFIIFHPSHQGLHHAIDEVFIMLVFHPFHHLRQLIGFHHAFMSSGRGCTPPNPALPTVFVQHARARAFVIIVYCSVSFCLAQGGLNASQPFPPHPPTPLFLYKTYTRKHLSSYSLVLFHHFLIICHFATFFIMFYDTILGWVWITFNIALLSDPSHYVSQV